MAEAAYHQHLHRLQALFDQHWESTEPWAERPEVLRSELKKTKNWQAAEMKGLSEKEILGLMSKKTPSLLYHPGGDTVMNISAIDSVAYYLRLLRSGFVALNPQNGAVLSWVGGLDFGYMPYDHVLARRQAASTFKPIVFAACMEAGIEPCSYWGNELREYPEYDGWTPQNYDNVYGGFYSSAGALKKSVNVATVQAMFEVGLDPVHALAVEMGFSSDLPRHPSLALGTGSVSPLEIARAYAVFANGGIGHQAYMVERITDSEGKVLYQRPRSEGVRVISENSASTMNAMLTGVVQEGTARSLSSGFGVGMELAGKTGTSQDYSDAWFVAYNPSLVAATWVGGIYPSIRFRSGAYGSSGKQALPMLAYFFKSLEKDQGSSNYLTSFPQLSNEQLSALDCPDYREKNIMDGIKGIFETKEGRKVKEKEEKEGLFERLFRRKKK
jgi:penicillin-binding protein 1A